MVGREDGVVWFYRFLGPQSPLTVLSEGCTRQPFGMCGGEMDPTGENYLFCSNGSVRIFWQGPCIGRFG